jgi:hypothetical protein
MNSAFGSRPWAGLAGGPPRRLDHRRGIGVDADHQPVGPGRGCGQDGAPVTTSQVDRQRCVLGD